METLKSNVKVDGKWLSAKDAKALEGLKAEQLKDLRQRGLVGIAMNDATAQRLAHDQERKMALQEEYDAARGKLHEVEQKLQESGKATQAEKDEKKRAKLDEEKEKLSKQRDELQAEVERKRIVLDFLNDAE